MEKLYPTYSKEFCEFWYSECMNAGLSQSIVTPALRKRSSSCTKQKLAHNIKYKSHHRNPQLLFETNLIAVNIEQNARKMNLCVLCNVCSIH